MEGQELRIQTISIDIESRRCPLSCILYNETSTYYVYAQLILSYSHYVKI